MTHSARPRVPLRWSGRRQLVGDQTLVMGIVNCTPDSFYDGGRHDPAEHYRQLIAEGADLVDVGGESTRPGAAPVSAEEEWRRVSPVLETARGEGHPVPLSIDTTKSEVAARALDAGAAWINDVSALREDAELADLAARYHAGLILMHMRGTPRTMQRNPTYADVMGEIARELADAIARARERGVAEEQIVIDPGIGFGKTAQHNLEIIRRLGELHRLGRPILMGCSRKSFIGAVQGLEVDERLESTLAAHTASVLAGAHIVRVHDVAPHVRAMRMADALLPTEP